MKIKTTNTRTTSLIPFDLLGTDEVALSKVFAYFIAKEPKAYIKFIRFLGLHYRNLSHLRNVRIEIERKRDEGRTDIELTCKNDYHIIVECKIRSNRLKKQRVQYIKSFNERYQKKILCFITQERDTNKEYRKRENVIIKYTSWLEIIELFNKKEFTKIKLAVEFLRFTNRSYKMNELKEILVQDLAKETEIKRFKSCNIYKRDITFGTPIYFAPYFTRKSKQPEGEGISYLSKILGVLTLNPLEIDNFTNDLHAFSPDERLVKKWVEGIKFNQDNKTHTYYFLNRPIHLSQPLKKSKLSDSKGWIGGMIPKNRCISFESFVEQFIKQAPKYTKK